MDIHNVVVVSDKHAGCQMGLCPPSGVTLDGGGTYTPSRLQQIVWKWWEEWWNTWVPEYTKGEDYVVVDCGDALDGIPHKAKTPISQNLNDQQVIAESIMLPVLENPKCKGYYHIRGTEAHTGKSAEEEEKLAKTLGAIPTEEGRFSRWELWLRVGEALVNFSHHIGTTASDFYETTALQKEIVSAFVEAGRWGDEPPDLIVRGHRHRHSETKVATHKGNAMVVVCPGWQLKTPYVHKITTGRVGQPQIGGIVIRAGHTDKIYVRNKVWRIERPAEVKI